MIRYAFRHQPWVCANPAISVLQRLPDNGPPRNMSIGLFCCRASLGLARQDGIWEPRRGQLEWGLGAGLGEGVGEWVGTGAGWELGAAGGELGLRGGGGSGGVKGPRGVRGGRELGGRSGFVYCVAISTAKCPPCVEPWSWAGRVGEMGIGDGGGGGGAGGTWGGRELGAGRRGAGEGGGRGSFGEGGARGGCGSLGGGSCARGGAGFVDHCLPYPRVRTMRLKGFVCLTVGRVTLVLKLLCSPAVNHLISTVIW
jgi:hypothetical protein